MKILHDKGFTLYFGPGEPFSNWYRAVTVIAGVAYCCIEQFMMAEKARLFGDTATLARIMRATDPKVHKAEGRNVTPFNEPIWIAHRLIIMYRGNLAKFQQHGQLGRRMLETGKTWIVEASPYDELWGIKLGVDDPRALDPSKWKGFNLLGKTQDTVRATLEQPLELQAEFAAGVIQALARRPAANDASATFNEGYVAGNRLYNRSLVFAA